MPNRLSSTFTYLKIQPTPLGALTGLILGEGLRIMRLCSDKDNAKDKVDKFYYCVLDRSYQTVRVTPTFEQQIKNAERHMGCSKEYQAYLKRQNQLTILRASLQVTPKNVARDCLQA